MVGAWTPRLTVKAATDLTGAIMELAGGRRDQEEGTKELLQAQARLWHHMFGFVNSMSLKCVVELGVPDAIHNHASVGITLTALASALGIPPGKAPHLRRLMRVLSQSGIFATQRNPNGDGGGEEGEEEYLLTDLSRHLVREDAPTSASFLHFILHPLLVPPWHSLSAWFRMDQGPTTAFEVANGEHVFHAAGRLPEFGGLFNEAMASDTRWVMRVVAAEHGEVFRGLRSLVDVGGGNGAAAGAIAQVFPQVKCSVLELPQVVATTPATTTVEFVAGDMFEYIPPADAVLLKWVLHDWSDENCVKILRRCKEAIPPKGEGGKVIVVEMVLCSGDGRPHHDQLLLEMQYFWDMHMLVNTEGKERDEREWRKIFGDAGFSDSKFTPALGPRSIIEVYP